MNPSGKIKDKVMRSMEKPPYTMRPPRRSTPEYYLEVSLPILLRRRALQLTKFDYRLVNILDEELQKLQCHVNYHALRFTKPIQMLGQKVVEKIRTMSSRFVAIHLRFKPDCSPFLAVTMMVVRKCGRSLVKLGSAGKHCLRYVGHKRTKRPNAKKLSSLFKARNQMTWGTFSRKDKSTQRGFMEEPDEMRPGRGDFHEFPYSCVCQKLAEPEGLPKLENNGVKKLRLKGDE